VTAVPVLVPPASGVLTQPYVTPGMFKGFPTWLDLDNLIPGGVGAVQDDSLADALLAASDWAVGECEDMLLHAHLVSGEQLRTRAGAGGRLYIKPRDIPVRQIIGIEYGWDPSAMVSLPLPCSSMWTEDGREVSFVPGGGLSFTGPAIQFGVSPATGMRAYINWTYVPGFPSTTISAVSAEAMSVIVADPTGILPGDTLRIYDPGVTEALTVASTYVPAIPTVPPTPTSIPLAAATANAHVAGTGITGMPRRLLQAVIAYTVALLMRDDVSEEEPASPFGPAARTASEPNAGKASGLVNDASGWLRPYAPTLRS
jgi:hypothetical protein